MKMADLMAYVKEIGQLLNFMDKDQRQRYYIGMFVSTLVHTLFILSFSLVIQNLVGYAESMNTALMYEAFYILGGALLLMNVLSPGFTYMFQKSVELTIASVRERLFHKVGHLPVEYFERKHNGDLMSRMNNDVATLEVMLSGIYRALLLDALIGLGAIIAMFVVNWKFALASLILVSLSFLISIRYVQSIRVLYERNLSLVGKMTEKLTDYMSGIQFVKLFHIRPVLNKFFELNEEATDVSKRIAGKRGALTAVNHFVSYITFCGIIVIGSLLYSYGLIGIGAVAALAVLQMNMTQSFMSLGTLFTLTQNSLAGTQRIHEILDEPDEPERYGSGDTSISSTDMIELRDIRFSYPEGPPVIADLSMRIKPGQVAAIVGASGSGKSTLIKLLLGFYPVDSGEVLLNGKPFGCYSLQEIRQWIAYVPQDAYLFSGTIKDNILYGNPDASDEEVKAAAKAAYADHFIEELPAKYDTEVGERGGLLSGGQRQRIAIARALLKNAPILLLDEATSALDSESEYWVQQALNELMNGRTTIMIAHRLSTVQQADQIFVMKQGAVVEEGTHQDLLERKSHYAKMYA